MKIGIVADAHGNLTALKSVIGDAKSKGVLDFLTVGDITMKEPSPQECVDLLKKENCLSWVLGNHEILYSKFLKNDSFGLDENREIMCHLLNDFDRKNMNEKTYYPLATLPEIKILKIQNLRLYIIHDFQMAVHNSAEFSGADIIICAHTYHQKMSWSSKDQIILNPGSVGLPISEASQLRDQRAQYLIVKIKNSEIARISFERIKYDVEKEIKIAYERELPYIKLYRETLRTCKYCYTPELISLENRQIRMESKYGD